MPTCARRPRPSSPPSAAGSRSTAPSSTRRAAASRATTANSSSRRPSVPIVNTIYDADRKTILHVPAEGARLPAPGAQVDRPHRLGSPLQAHARPYRAAPALRRRCPTRSRAARSATPRAGSTSTARRARQGRGRAAAQRAHRARRARKPTAGSPTTELDANPGLVKTMSVKPPMRSGRVRLVAIEGLDLQPCGGTHVARTGEIGRATVTQIEKKGTVNRRVRIVARSIDLRQPHVHPNFCTTAELAADLGDARPRRDRRVVASAERRAAGRDRIPLATSRARSSSTSTRSPTATPACRTCCRSPTCSRRRWRRSASATACASSSTTRSDCSRRRASGGRLRAYGVRTSAFSRAACRNGS